MPRGDRSADGRGQHAAADTALQQVGDDADAAVHLDGGTAEVQGLTQAAEATTTINRMDFGINLEIEAGLQA
ncbi:hypothetical protein RHCRD62_20067 [Rhodococcus sp. RD6.2]|nr:hypothetical protein RHCRD62_20067 [Rhodococcus sp. RD6.2]